MEFIKPGTYIDFMRYRRPIIAGSVLLMVLSFISLFVPGPKLGIDFAGGTELQLRFQGEVSPAELRSTLEELGYPQPDVVAVDGEASEYIIRVKAVTALPPERAEELEAGLRASVGQDALVEFRASPGGDKLSLRFDGPQTPQQLQQTLRGLGVEVREVNRFGSPEDFRYEAHLIGVGDELVRRLQQSLGERGPEQPLRIEWVGPKAGQQLRDAAIKSLLYAVAFIMVYVAFRFDLRFAPGGIAALTHDVLITLGFYVLFQRELNLTTVAALLTILGYSINDTIVVYDRIRENLSRAKDQSLTEIINLSTSQMLSRTLVTSGTTMLSVTAFLIWGTPVIQDIAFALLIGVGVGTYSSIYIAAPMTEFLDRKFFNRQQKAGRPQQTAKA